MTKFRHSISFVISAVVYLSLAFLYNSLLDIKKPIAEERPKRIKISLIEPKIENKPTPKPTIKPTPVIENLAPVVPIHKTRKREKKRKRITHKKRRVHKKIAHKKRVKHKEHKVVKKIEATPNPTQQPVVEEYIREPEIVEIYKPPPPTPQVQQEYIAEEITPQPQRVEKVADSRSSDNLRGVKRRFLKRVRGNIYANKHYPSRAKRRHIEGVVHTVFDIEADGEATNIRTSNAPSILQRAVRRSIESSFPIDIPPELIDKFPMRNISINIDFKLR
jgi:TonB family protein